MKLFVKNILLFLTLIITYTVIVNILPFKELSGNDHNLQKEIYFNQHNNNYNTIFLGSSRTFRHINPFIFDSICNKNGLSIQSFNFGTPATYYPECFYILEKLISNNHNIKYIFLELQPVNDIGKVNLFASKTYYYLQLKYLIFVFKYALNSDSHFMHKFSFLGKYFMAYFYKLIFGKYTSLIQQTSSGKYVLGRNNNGFLSLDEHIKITSAERKEISNNRNKLLKDTLTLQKRAAISINEFSNNSYYENKFFNNYLIKLANSLQNINIKLFFIIPPRLKTYKEFISLQQSEIKNNIIELANASKYPCFYEFKYSFDVGHLNAQGANVYTSELANVFIKLQAHD